MRSRSGCLTAIAACLLSAATALNLAESAHPELPNFHQVDAHLYRGGQPAAGGLARLREMGVRTVLNLRHEPDQISAEEAEAIAAGLRYVSLPMRGLTGPTAEQLDRALELFRDPDSWPVFVHCKAGADRTGVIVACHRIAQAGWSADEAIREADDLGMMKIAFTMRRMIREFHADLLAAAQPMAGLLPALATADPATPPALSASLSAPAPPSSSPSSAPAPIDQLWSDPVDLTARDLFHGPGGARLVPKSGAVYRFRSEDTQGHSGGYDVEDSGGRVWDVKIGDEAQSETAVSRLLWAIGYHQPVTYYVTRWRMQGGPTATPEPGRFRLESDHEKRGDWSWRENPFVGTRPHRGLLVANLILNNWDLAASNNRVYRVDEPRGGPATRFVVQDVGAALGKNRWPLGSRNTIEDFESQGFITGVEAGRVRFGHVSRHEDLLKEITPADVAWTCRMLARLSDRQLDDAFRAAGYPRDIRDRYIAKIKSKIRQGLALTPRVAAAG